MNTLDAFIIIIAAALIHASFQLSVSVLTLLSGHTIGKKRSHAKLLRLVSSFIAGTVAMTLLAISFVALVTISLSHGVNKLPTIVWVISCGMLIGLGVAVWAFYYRKGKGTALWLPLPLAAHLTERTKATQRSAEAFSLGLVSIVAEIPFVIGPMLVTALTLTQLEPALQLLGLATYAIVAGLPLITIGILVLGGHPLSRIQKWREENKAFLQFSSGAILMLLGFYLYVSQVIGGLHGGVGI